MHLSTFSTLHEDLTLERDSIQGEAFDNFPGYIDKEGVKEKN